MRIVLHMVLLTAVAGCGSQTTEARPAAKRDPAHAAPAPAMQDKPEGVAETAAKDLPDEKAAEANPVNENVVERVSPDEDSTLPAVKDQAPKTSPATEPPQADPLSELVDMGNAMPANNPQGGGSIRASRPFALSSPRIIGDHDPNERLNAKVVEVKRGEFPLVTLTLKLQSNAKAGPLKTSLRRGKTITAPVLLSGTSAGINYLHASNHTNLGAYYLTPGDRVSLHAVQTESGELELDFIERTAK